LRQIGYDCGVLHERHYTLEQASAVRGWVSERVGWIRDARAQLVALRSAAEDAIAALDADVGGSYPGRAVARPLVELSRALGELQQLDIVVRDIDRGLIDFPSIREGREIYLCWLLDEEEIRFWHDPEAGFAGRQPL
jgi:hypothetical protein